MTPPRLRSSEWLVAVYFLYVAAIAPFYMTAAWRTWIVAVAIAAGLWLSSLAKPTLRDFAPLAATLIAYREMNWFTPAVRDHRLEQAWINVDFSLLETHGWRAAIEKTGTLLPGYLELCYLLVYAVGPVVVAAAILSERRHRTDHLWMAYLAGTLGAYALFPYFPSEPPRTLYPTVAIPHIVTIFRQTNLWVVGGYGIHSSVFPSAHVSSAFSAAWGLLAVMKERRWMGWAMLAYAVSVSIATVYGRYHYAVDAAAGFVVSLVAIVATQLARERT